MAFLSRLRQRVFPGPSGVFLFRITLLTFVIRLVWNLIVHPPGEFITSDMRSYWQQSNAMLNAPWRPDPGAIFFPYGTAALLTLVRRLFGAENHLALGIVYAILGTLLVPLVFGLARRLTQGYHLPRLAAIVTCFYYPFISYGGYYLSELPFSVCVTATAFYALRLADRGRKRDAWLLGLVFAIGATFRPQLLASLPLLAVVWSWRRKSWPAWHKGHWIRLLVPIVIVSALSMGRFHHHTGRWGFISGNSALNYAFGRCHAVEIESRAVGYAGSFSPPPMGFLEWRELNRHQSFIRLDPALQRKISLHGYLGAPETFKEITPKCIQKTGYVRQVQYAIVHVIMLWGFNNAWPDSAGGVLRFVMLGFLVAHNIIFLAPILILTPALFRERFSRHALLALHLVALIVVAVLYFGDVRYRVPYDGVLIVLALDGWRYVAGWFVAGRWHAWR